MTTTSTPIGAVGGEVLQLATFYVADLCLALEIEQIQEIIRFIPVTAVPHAPPEVRGVINLRGEVTTVIDLRTLLGMPPSPTLADRRTLIVRAQGESIGLIVDRVADITAVHSQSLLPPPANVGTVDGQFFRGVSQRDDEIIVLLNLDEALTNLPSASK
jgi:purine-binding chemotaxis protein CheW